MDLSSKQVIESLLQQKKAKPIKRLGQNFLISKNALGKIIQAADVKKTDAILEIGAGIGILTQELAAKAKKVIAVEKDEKLIAVLKETLQGFDNIEIVHGDALKIDFSTLYFPLSTFKVVSNIPYYITSPLIKKFLEAENSPKQIILMVQKEVAQRICAKPPKMNLLAVAVQFYSQPKIISYVAKENFWPQPKVDSAIINLKVGSGGKKAGKEKREREINKEKFFKVVKAGFSHPRKQLTNNLSVGLKKDKSEIENWLIKNNINPQARAQHLFLDDWLNLSKNAII